MADKDHVNGKLLSAEERKVCCKVAEKGEELERHRAASLLALDDGMTQAQASEQTGLTHGQVKYLLAAFRQKHLAIFTADVTVEKKTGEKSKKSAPKDKKKKKDKKGKKDKKKSKKGKKKSKKSKVKNKKKKSKK